MQLVQQFVTEHRARALSERSQDFEELASLGLVKTCCQQLKAAKASARLPRTALRKSLGAGVTVAWALVNLIATLCLVPRDITHSEEKSHGWLSTLQTCGRSRTLVHWSVSSTLAGLAGTRENWKSSWALDSTEEEWIRCWWPSPSLPACSCAQTLVSRRFSIKTCFKTSCLFQLAQAGVEGRSGCCKIRFATVTVTNSASNSHTFWVHCGTGGPLSRHTLGGLGFSIPPALLSRAPAEPVRPVVLPFLSTEIIKAIVQGT